MTLPPFTTCPIMPVRELHGRTPKTHLARTLSLAQGACPGDIVALHQTGCMFDNSVMIAGTTFITMSDNGSGFNELRLCDFPSALKPRLMQCLGAINDDWEILEEFPSQFLEPGDDGPARLELIHCPGALMFLWLDEFRMIDMPPALLSTVSTPAALFIEEEDLALTDLRDRRLIDGQIALLECLSGMTIARLLPA